MEKVIEYGYDIRFFYKELIQHFRNLLLVKSVKSSKDLLPLNEEEIDDLRKEAEKASREELLRYLVVLQGGEQKLKFSSHPRIYLEVFLVKLCHFKKIADMKDVMKDLEDLKKGIITPSAKPLPKTDVQEPSRIPRKEESKPPEPEMKEPISPGIEKEKGKRGKEIDMAMKDPSVKSFMDTFKARVISVKPIERTKKKE